MGEPKAHHVEVEDGDVDPHAWREGVQLTKCTKPGERVGKDVGYYLSEPVSKGHGTRKRVGRTGRDGVSANATPTGYERESELWWRVSVVVAAVRGLGEVFPLWTVGGSAIGCTNGGVACMTRHKIRNRTTKTTLIKNGIARGAVGGRR